MTMGFPMIFNSLGERSAPKYLLPKRGFVTRTRVVSAKGRQKRKMESGEPAVHSDTNKEPSGINPRSL